MYFERRPRLVVWGVSISVYVLLLASLLLQGAYSPKAPYFIPTSQRINNAFSLGLMIVFLFPAFIEINNDRWLRGVDENIPRLLIDVSEDVRSGVPLLQALEHASERSYGPVSKPLSKAMIKFKLTSDLEEALLEFSDGLVRPVAKRLSTIFVEAYETGGEVVDVLDMSVDVFTSLAEYRKSRSTQMRPYTYIVYLGLIIFLIISWVILVQFLGPMHVVAEDPALMGSGVLSSLLSIDYYKSILFWAAVMESVFGGFVAGKIGTGKVSSGVSHTVILLFITVCFFNAFSV